MTETDRIARDFLQNGSGPRWDRDAQGLDDGMSPGQRRQARRLREAVNKCLMSHPAQCSCFVGMGREK